MQLALLVGANPRVCNSGPKVRLFEGQWQVFCEGLVDSELTLHNSLHDVYLDLDIPRVGVPMSKGGTLHVQFKKRGTEQSISVYAEKV